MYAGKNDEPKNRPGTGHVVKIDGDGKVQSEVWLNTDRQEMDGKDSLYYVQSTVSWALMGAFVSQILRTGSKLAYAAGVAPMWIIGSYLILAILAVIAMAMARHEGKSFVELGGIWLSSFVGLLLGWF